MKFEPNRPVSTTEAKVVVDAGLRPGSYRLQLVVVGTSGKSSVATEVVVRIEPP